MVTSLWALWMVGGPSLAQEAGTSLLWGNRLSINTIFTQSLMAKIYFSVQTRFCRECNLELGSNTTDKFEISRGKENLQTAVPESPV